MKNERVSCLHGRGIAKAAILATAIVVCGLTAYHHRPKPQPTGAPGAKELARIKNAYSRLPLAFEANTGQTAGDVKFRSRGKGYTLLLTDTGATLSLKKQVPGPQRAKGPNVRSAASKPHTQTASTLQMRLLGTKATAQVEGVDQLPGRSNYFKGNDPSKWRTNVPNYAKVRYPGVYPGVDLVYYGNQRQLEFDFVVAPHANPDAIGLKFDGARGMRVEPHSGDLVVDSGSGDVRLHKPVIYQQASNRSPWGVTQLFAAPTRPVDGRFAVKASGQVAFEIGAYDPSNVLVIDPTLVYSTYLGGSVPTGTMSDTDDETYGGIAVDSSGNAYVTGDTDCYDFPAAGNPFQPVHAVVNGDSDAFVTKFSADGSTLLYSTFLGGGDEDYAFAITVDGAGSAHVLGGTNSTDFPTLNPIQASFAGGALDAFVTTLSPDGSHLIYSTYLGGSGDDYGSNLAVDQSGDLYIVGSTQSDNFPVQNALQPKRAGGWDGFITKLSPSGSLIYSTYLGGSLDDYLYSLAIAPKGGIVLSGTTARWTFHCIIRFSPSMAAALMTVS